MRVLFSCFGKTDPARGEHDGGMLHILRHYRPDAVMIFMTDEMIRLDQADHRVSKTEAFVKAHWDGYAPEFIPWPMEIENPSDLDAVAAPLHAAIQNLKQRYPKAEVLVNLSSGTPQMKMILAQMTLELNGPLGIQVSSPEPESNKTAPTTTKAYPIEEELELTEEEETGPNAKNRCKEPKLIALRREKQRRQIENLLDRKDYRAVYEILSGQNMLPAEVLKMAEHLAERCDLQDKKAKKAISGLNTDFWLYPKKGDNEEYNSVSEYFLMMKCFQQAGRYTDFVLRLNPFTIRLQEALLDRLLKRQYRVSLSELKGTGAGRRQQLLERQLQRKAPALLTAINQRLADRGPFRDSDPSIHVYNIMLSAFSGLTEKEAGMLTLFDRLETLNRSRNQAAHELATALTDADIREATTYSCAELEKRLEQAIIALYPECDPAIFNVYQKCEEYIRQRL